MPPELKSYLKANIKIYPLPDTPGAIFLWLALVLVRGRVRAADEWRPRCRTHQPVSVYPNLTC